MSIEREFHMCVLGCSNVGKTSLLRKLVGIPFSRKNKCPPAEDHQATCYPLEVSTSAGTLLVNLYDWNWEEKRRDGSINGQLMRGRDGVVFVYDVTERRSKDDFSTQMSWYELAAGFDKPVIVVSNKNDQKKKSVRDDEGHSLASSGDRRAYAPISLADDEGVDDLVLALVRVMMGDPNISFGPGKSYGPASEESLAWSAARNSTAMIGMSMADMPSEKTKRVLLIVLNSSVAEKFSENVVSSEFVIEASGSVAMCAEELENPAPPEDGEAPSLPVAALMVPSSASESQKKSVAELAGIHGIKFVVAIPKNALEKLREAEA